MDIVHYINKNNVYQSKELEKTVVGGIVNYNVCIDDDSFIIGFTINGRRSTINNGQLEPQEIFTCASFINSDFVKRFVGGVRCLQFTENDIIDLNPSSAELIQKLSTGVCLEYFNDINKKFTFDDGTEGFSGNATHEPSTGEIKLINTGWSQASVTGLDGIQTNTTYDITIDVRSLSGTFSAKIYVGGVEVASQLNIPATETQVRFTVTTTDSNVILIRFDSISSTHYFDNITVGKMVREEGSKIETSTNGVIDDSKTYFIGASGEKLENPPYTVLIGSCPV